MGKLQVFLDTDVLISSIISETGASYEITRNPKIQKYISKVVKRELDEVSKRLGLSDEKRKSLLKNLKIGSLNLSKGLILERYGGLVSDEEDAHIVAGTHKMKAKFLLTHNIKHYNTNKINTDLGIVVLTPGIFLQYLRSQKYRKN